MKSKAIGIQMVDSTDGGELWALKIEPKLDDEGKIIAGVVIGSILHQNQAAILTAHPGEYKFAPKLGVGFQDELLGEDFLEARHKIKEQFPMDGLKVKKLDLYRKEKFEIEAEYE